MTCFCFFINHVKKQIRLVDGSAYFDIARTLRDALKDFFWSLDDHIQFLHQNGKEWDTLEPLVKQGYDCDFDPKELFSL